MISAITEKSGASNDKMKLLKHFLQLESFFKNYETHTEAKWNSATHSDLSVEMKDLEQIKGPERYLTLGYRIHA